MFFCYQYSHPSFKDFANVSNQSSISNVSSKVVGFDISEPNNFPVRTSECMRAFPPIVSPHVELRSHHFFPLNKLRHLNHSASAQTKVSCDCQMNKHKKIEF